MRFTFTFIAALIVEALFFSYEVCSGCRDVRFISVEMTGVVLTQSRDTALMKLNTDQKYGTFSKFIEYGYSPFCKDVFSNDSLLEERIAATKKAFKEDKESLTSLIDNVNRAVVAEEKRSAACEAELEVTIRDQYAVLSEAIGLPFDVAEAKSQNYTTKRILERLDDIDSVTGVQTRMQNDPLPRSPLSVRLDSCDSSILVINGRLENMHDSVDNLWEQMKTIKSKSNRFIGVRLLGDTEVPSLLLGALYGPVSLYCFASGWRNVGIGSSLGTNIEALSCRVSLYADYSSGARLTSGVMVNSSFILLQLGLSVKDGVLPAPQFSIGFVLP